MNEPDTVALARLAGQFGLFVIARYRLENPTGYGALTKLFQEGGARFDVCVRDATGFAPMVELVAVAGDVQSVIGSDLLKRRDPPPPAEPPS